jgi:peptide/nickel transport system substrate-binding protein
VIPEHVWKDVSSDEVKSYAAVPADGKPVVGSGPFRLVEGTAGGSTYRFEANPDYWNGTPHVDEVVFRVFLSEDPAVQALI